MKLKIDHEFSKRVAKYRAIIVECNVLNSPTPVEQQEAMNSLADRIAGEYKVEEINKRAAIAATRKAYKACGKDPNRYRPSQEQMMRRIVRGLGLYTVNSVVDAGNMLSLETGCSVGCFDADKIEGDFIELGIGRKDEPYEGIGRGPINIEGLPVFRDNRGGIGSPTSDNERTKITLATRRMLMTIHVFDEYADIDHIVEKAKEIFTGFCAASDFRYHIYSTEE